MPECVDDFIIRTASGHSLMVCPLGACDYRSVFDAMLDFTQQRQAGTQDQIWLLQHQPVYTQGTACQQNTLSATDIAIVKTDRGGQMTYHGPGQIIFYPLLNLKRYGLGVKKIVSVLEQAAIDVLQDYGLQGERKQGAPGVYVDGAKIAALGLRIRRGNSYHGLSFNVDMDIKPFSNIDPCGYPGLCVTQLKNYVEKVDADVVAEQLLQKFISAI